MSDPYAALIGGVTPPATTEEADPYSALAPAAAPVVSKDPTAPSADPYENVPKPRPNAAYPTVDDPTFARYGVELAKGVGEGLKTVASTALKGVAGMQADRPEYPPGQSPLDLAMQGDERAFDVYNAGPPTGAPLPTKQHPLYKAGEAVQQFGSSVTAPAKGFENSWTRDIGSGFGSVGGAIGLGLISAPAAMLSFVASGAGEATDNALKAGATPEQVARASRFGNIAGATDVVDILLPTLGTTGKALGFVQRVGLRAIKGAFAEGGQEGLQQLIQNAIAKGIYKPDQDMMEDVPRSVVIGAIVGGIATPALHRDDHAESDSGAPTDQEIEQAFNGVKGDPKVTAPPPPVQTAALRGAPGVVSDAPAPGASAIENVLNNPPQSTPLEPTEVIPPTSPTAPNVTRMETPQGGQSFTDFILAHPEMGYNAAVAAYNGTVAPPVNDIPSNVIDFIQRKSGQKFTATAPNDTALASSEGTDPNAPAKEEIATTPGANVGRLARLLGPKLYGEPTEMDKVTVKEILQNSFDAVKAAMEAGSVSEGKISINMDPKERTIRFYDNGTGMTPQVLGKQFLEIAGTNKESGRASGGLGIAKMLFLFANKNLRVITMRDGKVARLNTTGQQLFDAMDDKSKAPKINLSEPTEQERRTFKDGHGTLIEVQVPENFTNDSGEVRQIDFDDYAHYHPVLKNSPLFNNIEVKFNGKVLDGTPGTVGIGKHFPVQDFTPLVKAKFSWGTGHIYVSKQKFPDMSSYEDNMHVLSNGLWQFSGGMKMNPAEPYGEPVPHQFYVDLEPSVRPEDAGYPFDLNRQQFAKNAKEDLGKIFNYISVLYRHDDATSSAASFGNVHYLAAHENGTVYRSKKVTLQPKVAQAETPVDMIRPGDEVSVVDGRITVNGREVPEIRPEDVAKFTPSTKDLKIPQSEIDPKRIMIHDNVIVKISDLEHKSIVQLGEEKFGARFDDYLYGIGAMFKEMRDALVGRKVDLQIPDTNRTFAREYKGIENIAIGISFDTTYRGVNIVVPFTGAFINPAVPESIDPLQGAVGIVYTMAHELAHYNERNHSQTGFIPEMQCINALLDTHPTFDYLALKQRMVAHVAQNKDIFDFTNSFFTGAFSIEPRGKRFQDAGSNQTRDANGAPTGAEAVSGGGPLGRMASTVRGGPTTAGANSGRPNPNFGVREAGTVGLLAETEANGRATRTESRDPGMGDIPAQQENVILKDGLENLFQATSPKPKAGGPRPPSVPPSVAAMTAHADSLSKYYKYMMGLDRLVDRFPGFTPLLRYAERVREMKLDSSKIQDAALRIAKDWRSLGDKAEPLAALIDDVANMRYRTDVEVKAGTQRHPSKAEFADLVKRHKVSAAALRVFMKQKDFFHGFLQLVVQNAKAEAMRNTPDPIKLQSKLDRINAEWAELNARPYFPFLNFGTHYVAVTDPAGEYVFFRTYERQGLKSAEAVQKAAAGRIQKGMHPGFKVLTGVLPETTQPFVGLPRVLLDSITATMSLTPAQKAALQQMRFGSTASRFSYLFEHKAYVPGYSHDFLRAFSRYAFHGARFYARTKYVPSMQQEITNARLVGGNQAGTIANYLEDHLYKTVLDAKGDYGLFKGAIFLWVFGYSVAGATINLTQVPFLTHPFLASRFGGLGIGDGRALKALAKAGTQLQNFYKRGSYEKATSFELKALDYGVKTGRITEAQASELAGLAQGDNLLGMGRGKMGRFIQQWVLENGAKLFEFTEQYNRRVTYRAALDLATAHPNSQGVKEAMNKHADEFNQLVSQGWNAAEAKAVVTAAYVTEQTQFSYARENRPRFMRGKMAGTVLVFQNYMVNVLQLLGANKSSVLPRYMLMMLVMGGLMGLPGADELEHAINLLGKYLFGKDFKAQLWLREMMLELGVGDKADLVLHGLSRRGFGLPAMLDLMGEHPGRGLGSGPGQNIPAPVLDRSKAVGMGRILPVDIEKLFDPGKDMNKALAEQGQRASGAVFSVGFNLYRAIFDMNTPAGDPKRWEKAMPRSLGSVSRAYRAFTEGRERGRGGPAGAPTVVPYDVRDPEQMAEIIAIGLGYTPLRQSAKWDAIIALQEVNTNFDIQREMLLKQRYEAIAGGNKQEIDKVNQSVIDYNEGLPDWAKGKMVTGQGAEESLRSHFRDREAKEAGLPSSRKNRDMSEHIQSLFPESVVDVRRVK